MTESQQVLEWISEGEIKGEVKFLLRCLETRFPPGPPADLIAQIQATTDPEQLNHWFGIALTAPSLEAFQQAISRNGSQ